MDLVNLPTLKELRLDNNSLAGKRNFFELCIGMSSLTAGGQK